MSGEAKFGEPWRKSTTTGQIVDRATRLLSTSQETRAIACVNACQGIANPAAVPAVLEAAREANAVLIETGSDWQTVHRLEAALAALEGT